MKVSWNDFKYFVNSRSLNIQGIETSDFYLLKAKDDFFILECELLKNPSDTTDIDEFITSYKPNWNQKLTRVDSEGIQLTKEILAGTGFLYQPRSIDFTTSKNGSLCTKRSNMIPYSDCELRFFNSQLQQIFKQDNQSDEEYQSILDSTCNFTWMIYKPNHRYAIRSGFWLHSGMSSSAECDLWVEIAPHIPEEYGGCVPFISGGVPLDMWPEKTPFVLNGSACAIIDVDNTNFSHWIGVKIEHDIGGKIGILACFEIYK